MLKQSFFDRFADATYCASLSRDKIAIRAALFQHGAKLMSELLRVPRDGSTMYN